MATKKGFQLTSRDLELLEWTGRHGIVTPGQIARKFFSRQDGQVGYRAANRRLAKLRLLGLLLRDPTAYRGTPYVVRLTTAGTRKAEIDLAPARLIEAELRHCLALVDLMEQLATSNPDAILRTERELRTDRGVERMEGRRQLGRGRLPDGEFTLATGRLVAIELDLTAKRTIDIERAISGYRSERYDLVWWYVLPGAVARYRKVVAQCRADDFIEIRSWLTMNPPAAKLQTRRAPDLRLPHRCD